MDERETGDDLPDQWLMDAAMLGDRVKDQEENLHIQSAKLDALTQILGQIESRVALVESFATAIDNLEDRINDLAEVNRRRTVNISQLRRRVADLENEIGELQQKETL